MLAMSMASPCRLLTLTEQLNDKAGGCKRRCNAFIHPLGARGRLGQAAFMRIGFLIFLLGLSACAGVDPAMERGEDAPLPSAAPAPQPAPPPAERTFEDRPDVRTTQEGVASWYGRRFAGRPTANGEIFDPDLLTAAHPTMTLPSLARVTRLDTGASVMVRVNDRGPFVADRIIDLSRAAADRLGFVEDGLARVRVEALGPADAQDRAAAPVFFDPDVGPPRSEVGESLQADGGRR